MKGTSPSKLLLSNLVWYTLGRRNMVRLSRFLANESRLDVSNDPGRNGEYAVLRTFLAGRDAARRVEAIDVGANIGDWTKTFLDTAAACGRAARVHAFEPCPATCATLHERLGAWRVADRVVVNQQAASSACGAHAFYSVGDNVGRNSLYAMDTDEPVTMLEVSLTTLDHYCRAQGLAHVDFLKIDAEGHDVEVLHGCRETLAAGRLDLVQFEYNQCWIKARHFLRDVFEFCRPLGLALGKVTPRGIEFYDDWHYELETFREANFVVMKPALRTRFKEIRWWNTP